MAAKMDKGLVGQKLGQYQIEAILGRGGMGTVYRGTHERIGRVAAIKVLSDALALNDEFVSRFVNEAKVVNNIRHKSIIDIVEFIEEENPRRVAYIMELIEGPTLTELMRSRTLNLVEAVNIALQLASAMKAVHAVGVIHRDLKPDNILIDDNEDVDLTEAGSIRILDFGIAKLTGAEDVGHRTATGAIIGTPVYMAPEQASIHEITTACDVFAVGEILYEMVTAKRVFAGDNMAILRAKVRGDIPDISIQSSGTAQHDVELVNQIQALIRDCVEYRPESRIDMQTVYESLKEIRQSLQPMVRSASMPTIAPRSLSVSDVSAPQVLEEDKEEVNAAAFQTNSITASGLLDKAKSSPNYMVWGVIALGLSVSIVLAATFLSGSEPHRPPRVVAPPAAEKSIKSPPPASEKIPSQPIEAEIISVEMISVPTGALLIEVDTQQELGITPMAVEVTKGQVKKIQAKAAGYRVKFVELDGQASQVKLNLQRIAKKPASPPELTPAVKRTNSAAKPRPKPAAKPVPKPVRKPIKKKPAPAMKKGEVPQWSDW